MDEAEIFIAILVLIFFAAVVYFFRKKIKKATLKMPFFTASFENFEGNENGILRQKNTSVLFIDDDTRFKIVRIIGKNPTVNCRIVKDISNYQEEILVAADIVFVDVEGVGRILTPRDEGLGLVVGIKERYPEKKVIIYSTTPERDMTHVAFRMVDGVLRKDAQPSDFIKYIDRV